MSEWRDEIRRRLSTAKLSPEREAGIVEEVAQHLDDRYRESLAAGVVPDQAAAAAWRELDAEDVLGRELANVERPERVLPPPGAPIRGFRLAALWQDTRDALRRVLARPAFASTAIVTVALSVGPATAIIGVADALFFRQPAGVEAPDRLIKIWFGRPSARGGFSPWFVSYANVSDVLAGAKSFTDMTGTQGLPAGLSAKGSAPRYVDGQSVKANFFRMLGVPIVAGRGFLDEEDATPGGVASVVLSELLARDLFAAAAAAVGQTIQLNSVSFTVVGVTGGAFDGAGDHAKFWITGMADKRVRHFKPDQWSYETNRGPFYTYIVRLAPGASVPAAEAELHARTAGLAAMDHPDANLFKTVNMQLLPGFGAPRALNKDGVEIVRLLAVVASVLVMLGIANMANLLSFQGLKASREIAIRKALGASRARLVQQTLLESLVLSLLGTAVGMAVALGIQALLADLTMWGIGTITVPLDARVLVTTTALAVVTGIAFGVGPAVMTGRGVVLGTLGRGLQGELPRTGRLRQGLAAVQLSLSLLLLVGALLFIVTLDRLSHVELGLDVSHVTTMHVDLNSHGYDTPRIFNFYRQVIDLVKQQPGVQGVAFAAALPLAGASNTTGLRLPDADPKSAPEILVNFVSSGYFDVLRIPIARGRAFTPAESFASSPPSSIILSATAAKVLFGDADPLGQLIVQPGRPRREFAVIGVTGETRWRDMTHPPDSIAYMPFFDGFATFPAAILVRSSRSSPDVARTVQSAAVSLDPAVPLFREQTMSEVIWKPLARQRLFGRVLALLAGIGFVLAAVGVYSLISQMVAERSREFGIRIAIGADRSAVSSLVLRQTAIVTVVGATAGIGAAMAIGRLIEANLFGVTTRDPLIYAGATGLLVAVVLLATLGPARRATRVDPVSILRAE